MQPSLVCRALVLALGLSVLAAGPSRATTFSFGTPVLSGLTSNVSSGSSGDLSVSQAAFSSASNANFRAQASADSLVSDALAEVTYVWDVPYTITRNVSVSAYGPGPAQATFPLQVMAFDITFSGAVALDDDFFTDEEAQIFSGFSVSSLAGLFTAVSFSPGASRIDSDGVTLLTPAGQLTGYGTTVNFEDGSSAGEISFAVPSDYRAWEDFVAPLALDYSTPQIVPQFFADTLRVSLHLRAFSEGGGGEALACAGLESTLSNFDLVANCGSGFNIFGQIGENGSETLPVPEPGTSILLAAGVGMLAALRRRLGAAS